MIVFRDSFMQILKARKMISFSAFLFGEEGKRYGEIFADFNGGFGDICAY